MSGPNGEGLPPTTAALPTHILVTDELVKKALWAYEDGFTSAWSRMERALSAVAPDLFAAGMRAAIKLGAEEAKQAQRDETEEERDTTREVGAGSGYELSPSGEVQPAEAGTEAGGDHDQAGQEGVGPSPKAGWWKSPPASAAERD